MSGQCAVWDCRFNADPNVNHQMIIDKFNLIAKKWVFQKEKGHKTGYEHYQCRISLRKKTTKNSLLKLFDDVKPNYLEPTSAENAKNDNVFYVIKEDTRIEGPWKSTDPKPKFIPRQFRNIKDLYPMQQTILDSTPDSRCVDVISDTQGENGKTVAAFLAYYRKNAEYVPPMNDAQKLIEFIFCIIDECEDDKTPDMFIFDLPRSMSKDCLYGMYSAIEQLKNGFIYDTRYKGKRRWINSPAIWVFTNEVPDVSRLSADRWRIWNINDKKELIKYCPPKLPPDDIGDEEIIVVPKKRLIKTVKK